MTPLEQELLDEEELPEDQQIMYINLNSTFSTDLPYVYIQLSLTDRPYKYVTVQALHDSGCSQTMISKSAYLKIPGANLQNIQPTTKFKIAAFDGKLTPALGMVKLNLTFKGEGKHSITIPRIVLVHEFTTHDFMLGRDFTGSDAKIMETNTHLYLTDQYQGTGRGPTSTGYKEDIVSCKVPIHQANTGRIPITSTAEIEIPPYSVGMVQCKIFKHNKAYDLRKHRQHPETPFTLETISQPMLQSPEAIYYLTSSNTTVIPFYNNTAEDYYIPPNTKMGHIQIQPQDAMSTWKVHQADETYISVNNVQFIEESEILNDKEKEDELKIFRDSGKHIIPMSSYIEGKPSITEFEYKPNIRKEETQEEFINKFQLDHLPPKAQQYAKQEFIKVREAFSKHDYDLGRAKNFEMDIEVDTSQPRIQKYFPLPYRVREDFRKALDQMIEFGIIRECNEPSLFCSNLLVTRKKNGTLRILLDGRLLNHATIRKPMCLVSTYETYAHLAKKKHVSVMDMSHSFFQIPLTKEAQPLTAFFSDAHGKRFCFTRAPQGLRNSPLYLKLLTDEIFGDMALYVLSYADDIMIATDKDLYHHIDTTIEVLRRLRDKGIKMRPEKINLASDTIEFLGVIWNKGTLKIPEAKLLAFKNYPVPTTAKKVKSFVCAMSYYRKFIPRFAQLAKPLLDLSMVRYQHFKWLPIHQEIFDTLIKSIVNYSALIIPDPDKDFYVQTDSSTYAAAGRVFQLDEEGEELLIACVSRTYTITEQGYAIFRKEVLALLYTLKSLDFFLRFAVRLIILIDAKAILFLRMCKESAGILIRFSIELSKYEAEVYHVPGKDNIIADILSRNLEGADEVIRQARNKSVLSEKDTVEILNRLSIPAGTKFTAEQVAFMLGAESLPAPVGKEKKKSTAKEGKRQLANLPKTLGAKKLRLPPTSFKRPGLILPPRIKSNSVNIQYQDLNALCRIAMDGTMSKETLKEIQSTDEEYGDIYHNVGQHPHFLKHQDLLFYNKDDIIKLVLPKSLLLPMVNSKHYSIHGVHFSQTRIKRDITSKYYVKPRDLNQVVKDVVNSCITCQMSANVPTQQVLKRFDKVTLPRTTWAIDLIPNMNKTEEENTTILIAIDMYTCYIQAIPLKNRSTKEIIAAIKHRIIAPFGTPEMIRSDNETGMENSTAFYDFCHEYQIQFLPTSTGAPWANGAAERAVQTIKRALKLFVVHEHCINTWDKKIHLVTNAHNKSVGVYGITPEEAMFGYSNPNKTDIITLWPEDMRLDDYTNYIVERAHEQRRKMKFETERHMKRNLTYRNKSRKEKQFSRGNVVIHRHTQVAVGPNSATQSKYDGPYIILEVYPEQSQALLENMTTKRTMKAHYSNIQRLKFNPQHNRVPENLDDTLDLYFPERQSQMPTQTQTQTQQHIVRDSQPPPGDPDINNGTDNPDQRDGTDKPKTQEATQTKKPNKNPFEDSDEDEGQSNQDNNDTDWDQFGDFQWSQRSSQRPGTPFNRSPADASPDEEIDQGDIDFQPQHGTMFQEDDDLGDTGTPGRDSPQRTQEEGTTETTEEEDTIYVTLKTVNDSQVPQIVDVKRLPKPRIPRTKARQSEPKKKAEPTQALQPIKVVIEREAEQQGQRQKVQAEKPKVKITHVQEENITLMQDTFVKPKRGRPKKGSEPKKTAEKENKQARKVEHKYNTRGKAATPASNTAQVYTLDTVLYLAQQSDGTYQEVYSLKTM